MSFPSIVTVQSAAGVPGDWYDDSPRRALPYTLVSASANNNLIGTTFCTVSGQSSELTGQDIAQAGGTGILAGLLINSKIYALRGTPAGGTLAPTLQLPNQTEVELATMGRAWVFLPAAANIGDNVIYNTTTGQIGTIPPATPVPVGSAFAFATVIKFNIPAAGIAAIELSPTLIIPS